MLRKLLITFFLIIPLALFAVLLMLYFWGPVLTFGPVVILILFFIKVRRQRMMLVLIQNALETDTPVEEVLEAYARTGWSPRYRNKVLRFAQNLRDGHSIASAAQACRGVLRHDAVGLIRLGGDTDQIGALLAQTVDEARRMSFVQLQSLIRLAWFCGYFPVMMVVPVFCMMWIMPKFEAIFMDFGTQLPASTISVLAISQFLIRYFPGIGTPLFVLIFLPFLYFIARSGILPYRPPGTRKMLRQLDAARFLRIFAAGLEMKKSIPEIVEPYSFTVPSRYLCHQASRFLAQVEQGRNWIDTLTQMGWLTKSEAALAEAAQRVENVPCMLREIAAGKQERQAVADAGAGKLVFLLFVLSIGCFVAFFAIAFFMPLVKLIQVLA